MNGKLKTFVYLLLVSLPGACSLLSGPQSPTSPAAPDSTSETLTDTAPIAATEEVPLGQASSGLSQAHQQIIEMGSGEFISQPTPRQKSTLSTQGEITLNFQDTDIREFINVILGDVLGVSYVVDPKVGGKVTVETASPVQREKIFPMFEEILAINGAAIVKSGDLYQVLPMARAIRGNTAPTVVKQNRQDGYGVRIIPLRFIASQEMQKILEPFLQDSGNLRIDKKRNLLIVSGTNKELDLIQETIDIFDVEWLRGMSMGLYPLDYVDAKTLKTELDSIIGAIEGEAGKELLGGLVRTVPLERLNSILLISSTSAALREVEIWVYRLDRPGEHVGQRLYVYNVQNAKATELADILGHVFGASGSPGITQIQAPALAPGLTPVEIGSNNQQQQQQQQQPPQAGNKPAGSRTVGEGVGLPSSDTIEIIADDVRNALVVLASPQDYKMVEATIKKLDVVPLQVLIEASILEVTLRDNLSYGVEWFFKNSINNSDYTGVGTLDLGSAISALAPGFSYTVLDQMGVHVALNMLENESDVNVLSSPSLMVLDNQTATINVGNEIPVPTRQSISNLDPNAPTVNEIQFRKTGVTLSVTPRVNSGGLVTMEIKQEVSSAVATTTSDIDAPTIQNRMIESVVAINSEETLMLGGLIQDTKTNSVSGIPFLHRIPILGKLFSRTIDEMVRTELLILITPRVVSNRDDARRVTDEFRRKLRGITPLEIKRTIGIPVNPPT